MEVTNFGSLPCPRDALHEGEIANPQSLRKSLGQLLEGRRERTVYLALPERHTFLKHFELQEADPRDLAEAVRWEASQHIPYDPSELSMDWTTTSETQSSRPNILVAAVPQTFADAYVNVFELQGFSILALEPTSLAVSRAFSHELPMSDPGFLIFLGDAESIAVVVEDNTPILTAQLPLTVGSLEQNIKEHFSLDDQDVSRARSLLGFSRARAHGVVRKVLTDFLSQLGERLRVLESFYLNYKTGARPVRHALVCGAGATTAGIGDALSDELGYRVVRATLPEGVQLSTHNAGFSNHYLEHTVTLGLALRSTDLAHV